MLSVGFNQENVFKGNVLPGNRLPRIQIRQMAIRKWGYGGKESVSAYSKPGRKKQAPRGLETEEGEGR